MSSAPAWSGIAMPGSPMSSSQPHVNPYDMSSNYPSAKMSDFPAPFSNGPMCVGPPESPNRPPNIASSFFSSSPPVDPQKQQNPYVIHWNRTVGLGTSLGDKGSVAAFPTYEISPYFVNDYFHGREQPWNRQYPQAQKIFG